MTPRHQTASEMAEAAASWLGSLDDEQHARAHGAVPAYDDPSDAERRRWFYTPTDHGGLTVHDQRPAQQRAAMRLVATGLSMAGYVTVATTIGLENVIDRVEGFVTRFDRERGRDPGLCYVRVFGEPGGERPWGWRFGGHHVSLNNLVVDGELVATMPCFMGADPTSSPLLGGALNRPLGRVEDLGRELVRSLSPELTAISTPASASSSLPSWRRTSNASPTASRRWRRTTRTRWSRTPRVGRLHPARPPALLPRPGSAAPPRVGQHPARRQPRPLGLARPPSRLRPGPPRRPRRRPPLTVRQRSGPPPVVRLSAAGPASSIPTGG